MTSWPWLRLTLLPCGVLVGFLLHQLQGCEYLCCAGSRPGPMIVLLGVHCY